MCQISRRITLTSYVMRPGGAPQQEGIVGDHEDVQSLVHQEHVPALDRVLGVIVCNNAYDLLWGYERDASTNRDPAEEIGGSACIALAREGSHQRRTGWVTRAGE